TSARDCKFACMHSRRHFPFVVRVSVAGYCIVFVAKILVFFRGQHYCLLMCLNSVKHPPSMELDLNYLPGLRSRLLYNLDARTIHRELLDVLRIMRETTRKVVLSVCEFFDLRKFL